ncbi:MAG: group 1 truncated hemoglobin [Kofleriaceae bacterium]
MRILRSSSLACSFVVAAATALGCGGSSNSTSNPGPAPAPTPAVQEGPLFERLGGLPAIEAVVKTFIDNVAADSRINAFFINTNIPELQAKLVEQICEATGGPCTYSGKSMREVHTGMRISEADFAALVEDLQAALDEWKVPAREQDELLGALGGMHDDIVGL